MVAGIRKIMKKGEIINVDIQENISMSKSLSHYEGEKIVIDGGLAGQNVDIRIAKKRSKRIEATIQNVVKKADYEVEPSCEDFNRCGGCRLQNVPYEKEIEMKKDYVLNLFRKAQIEYKEFDGITPSPLENGYRNKMEFSFGDEIKDGPLCLGMHEKGKHHNIVPLKECDISADEFNIIRNAVQNYFREKGTKIFNKFSKEGYLRHLVLRKSFYDNKVLVNLVTTTQDTLDENAFVKLITDCNVEIAGILYTQNDSFADAVRPETVKLLYGEDYLIEKINNLLFKISPFSFFQTNSLGAEVLYDKVISYCGDIDNKIVFDLYSGTGTIAQIAARKAKNVYGIEIVDEAVEKAKQNATLNDLTNCNFICGDVLKEIDELNFKADIIILDPPRAGLHPKAIEKLLAYECKTIVYVSCKATSLINDLPYFLNAGYSLDRVGLVDMFPRTEHVECVVLMSRVEK